MQLEYEVDPHRLDRASEFVSTKHKKKQHKGRKLECASGLGGAGAEASLKPRLSVPDFVLRLEI